MELKNKKIKMIGKSHYVLIPMQYINDKLINKDKRHNIIFNELK